MKKRDTRQGAYALINVKAKAPKLYIGKTAGGPSRGFARRFEEHITELDRGTHPNNAMRRQHAETGGRGWIQIPLACVRRGDDRTATAIENALITALGRRLCNEKK